MSALTDEAITHVRFLRDQGGASSGYTADLIGSLTSELIDWEAAAQTTDIYEYLRDALSRMGTVGPLGIREMIAYCLSLKDEIARLKASAGES